MRVWLVNHHALPPSEPGGTRHYALAREMNRLGHKATVIASSFNHSTGKQMACAGTAQSAAGQFDGVPFVFLRVPSYGGRGARLWNMVVFALKLWSGIGIGAEARPDIVLGSSLTLLAALSTERLAKRWKVPFVLEIRDLWPQTLIDMGMSRRHPVVIGFGFIERYLYRNANHIVTLLPNASEYMVARGARASDITWIPNGFDMDFMPEPRPPIQGDVFTTMYMGSHGLSDTLDPVLDAASILHANAPGRFCFRFVGNGPEKSHLRRRVESERIANVMFEDPLPKLRVFSVLQEADAFIISSKRTDLYRYGISPNKLHEYMAAGRPTVLAGSPHNNPVADASAGLTVPAEDAEAIAAALQRLAEMPLEQRWATGCRGRAYVQEHHDFRKLAQQLEQAIHRASETYERRTTKSPAPLWARHF